MRKVYIKSFIGGLISNEPRPRIKEKLVVFESDDWGAIRTPNKEALRHFKNAGMDVDNSRYSVDSLASGEDLDDLFSVLLRHRDANGNPAKFTANCIMANPDFDKIRNDKFEVYHYEPFFETFSRYPTHGSNLAKWKDGMRLGVFHPQFHGREHLNVRRWLRALKRGDKHTRLSFDWRATYSGIGDYSFMEAFDWDAPEEVEEHKKAVKDGLLIFEKAFGFRSRSFIAPCYTWDSALEPVLVDEGVRLVQGLSNQLQPQGNGLPYKRIRHRFGHMNSAGLYFGRRNCFLEPVSNPDIDWSDKVLARMQAAFLLGKPAIISTHRVNYVGYIDQHNKDVGLRHLDTVLKRMLRAWPELQFVSSEDLLKYFY